LMTSPNSSGSFGHACSEAIAAAIGSVAAAGETVGKTVAPTALNWVERSTETVGKMVTPIAENPLVKYATQVPGIKWILAALGQVSIVEVEQDVAKLRQQYPLDTAEQLAQRVIADVAFKAAGIGLATNVAPPFALALFGFEVAAINALQAEMLYRIAAIYGFPLNDPTRRGEAIAIWGLSMGGSSVIKAGLSIVELIPLVGTAIGISSDAALLYALGYVACRFYENKQASVVQR
jgi:uncharacterized protein (DUF697 family)